MIRVKGKKVNPGKSNKLIWAVTIGLVAVFAAFFIGIGRQAKTPPDKKSMMLGSLAYLKRVPGIIEIAPDPEANRITLVYDGNFEGDFQKIARFAALRLSSEMIDIELTLARNRPERPVYRIRLKKGEVASEQVF